MSNERVLTDEELLQAYWSGTGHLTEAVQNVEAAVLAKLHRDKHICVDPQYVPESECRRREILKAREAWDAGVRFVARQVSGIVCPGGAEDKERDRRYPLPRVTRPREITLSNGQRYRFVGGWQVWNRYLPTTDWDGPSTFTPYCLTAEDAAKVADVWAHPTEEVEDGP